jgi:hypothetical protein
MNEGYFVHILGHAEPLPLDHQTYETLRKELSGTNSPTGFYSINVAGKAKFSFRISSVAMIEERP